MLMPPRNRDEMDVRFVTGWKPSASARPGRRLGRPLRVGFARARPRAGRGRVRYPTQTPVQLSPCLHLFEGADPCTHRQANVGLKTSLPAESTAGVQHERCQVGASDCRSGLGWILQRDFTHAEQSFGMHAELSTHFQ